MKASFKHTKFALLLALFVIVGLVVAGTSWSSQTKRVMVAAAAKDKKEEPGKKIDPADPSSVIYLDTSGKAAGVGDPTKPPSYAYRMGRGWHPQALAAVGLPKDRYGLIDWAKLVRESLIKPRFSLDPNDEEMPPLKLDILIPAKGDFVDDVIYPHEMHTWWLKCEICHPKIFIPAKGQNDMSMVGIANGQWCGRCHGKIAFPLTDCKRCHVSPKSASKQ